MGCDGGEGGGRTKGLLGGRVWILWG